MKLDGPLAKAGRSVDRESGFEYDEYLHCLCITICARPRGQAQICKGEVVDLVEGRRTSPYLHLQEVRMRGVTLPGRGPVDSAGRTELREAGARVRARCIDRAFILEITTENMSLKGIEP